MLYLSDYLHICFQHVRCTIKCSFIFVCPTSLTFGSRIIHLIVINILHRVQLFWSRGFTKQSFIIHPRPALKCCVISMDKEPAQAVKLHFFAFHLGMKG